MKSKRFTSQIRIWYPQNFQFSPYLHWSKIHHYNILHYKLKTEKLPIHPKKKKKEAKVLYIKLIPLREQDHLRSRKKRRIKIEKTVSRPQFLTNLSRSLKSPAFGFGLRWLNHRWILILSRNSLQSLPLLSFRQRPIFALHPIMLFLKTLCYKKPFKAQNSSPPPRDDPFLNVRNTHNRTISNLMNGLD